VSRILELSKTADFAKACCKNVPSTLLPYGVPVPAHCQVVSDTPPAPVAVFAEPSSSAIEARITLSQGKDCENEHLTFARMPGGHDSPFILKCLEYMKMPLQDAFAGIPATLIGKLHQSVFRSLNAAIAEKFSDEVLAALTEDTLKAMPEIEEGKRRDEEALKDHPCSVFLKPEKLKLFAAVNAKEVADICGQLGYASSSAFRLTAISMTLLVALLLQFLL
jgi:hypothetical protein